MTAFPSRVVGIRHYPNASNILRARQHNDPLDLIQEPHNPYHKWAVAVYDIPSKLGHIPWSDAEVIGPLMDLGVTMTCRIRKKPPLIIIYWDAKEAQDVQKQVKEIKHRAPETLDTEILF